MIHALFLSSTCIFADGSVLMSKVVHVFFSAKGWPFLNVSYDVQDILALCVFGGSLLPAVVLGVWEYV